MKPSDTIRSYCEWLPEEEDRFRQLYPVLAYSELREQFKNRSQQAISTKAHKLGLRKQRQVKFVDRWTGRRIRSIERQWNKPFLEIYEEKRQHGLAHKTVAEQLAINERTLTRWLNYLEYGRERITEAAYLPRTQFRLTAVEYAYLAGFLDGDGSIHMSKASRPNAALGFLFIKGVSFHNTNLELMRWIASKLGCQLNEHPHGRTVTHKPVYQIDVTGFDAILALLTGVVPYLIAKKERAELLLRFSQSRLRSLTRHSRYGKSAYTVEEIALADTIIQLNRKYGHAYQ